MGQARKIGVLAGGQASEHRISLQTGRYLAEGTLDHGHVALPLLIGTDGAWNLGEPVVTAAELRWPEAIEGPFEGMSFRGDPVETMARARALGLEACLIGLHGRGGEDGSIQGFLDVIGVPYSGSGTRASAFAIDKHRCKQLLAGAGLPVPVGLLVDPQAPDATDEAILAELAPPFVVKALDLGSSVSVRPVPDLAAAPAALAAARVEGAPFLVEEWIAGEEFTCGVIGRGAEATALPPIQIVPRPGTWFDYASKYGADGAEEICPAPIDAQRTRALEELAMQAHRALGARGVTRTDFLEDPQRGPLIIEVNTLPGLTPASLVPQAAAVLGWDRAELVGRLIADAEAGS